MPAHAMYTGRITYESKKAFAKKYNSCTVKEAIRFEGAQEVAYYISAENEKGSVVLKVEDSGFMSTVKK